MKVPVTSRSVFLTDFLRGFVRPRPYGNNSTQIPAGGFEVDTQHGVSLLFHKEGRAQWPWGTSPLRVCFPGPVLVFLSYGKPRGSFSLCWSPMILGHQGSCPFKHTSPKVLSFPVNISRHVALVLILGSSLSGSPSLLFLLLLFFSFLGYEIKDELGIPLLLLFIS